MDWEQRLEGALSALPVTEPDRLYLVAGIFRHLTEDGYSEDDLTEVASLSAGRAALRWWEGAASTVIIHKERPFSEDSVRLRDLSTFDPLPSYVSVIEALEQAAEDWREQ